MFLFQTMQAFPESSCGQPFFFFSFFFCNCECQHWCNIGSVSVFPNLCWRTKANASFLVCEKNHWSSSSTPEYIFFFPLWALKSIHYYIVANILRPNYKKCFIFSHLFHSGLCFSKCSHKWVLFLAEILTYAVFDYCFFFLMNKNTILKNPAKRSIPIQHSQVQF